MPTISLFKINNCNGLKTEELAKKLDGEKFKENWIIAKQSKYNKNEVFIQYWYYEDVEKLLKRVFGEDFYDILKILKQHNKEKILKRIYAFLNVETKTLEIYSKSREKELKELFEKILGLKFEKIVLSKVQLEELMKKVSIETKELTDRAAKFIPKITYLNNDCRYSVVVTNRGDIRFRGNSVFSWRPRFEIRQLTQAISCLKN